MFIILLITHYVRVILMTYRGLSNRTKWQHKNSLLVWTRLTHTWILNVQFHSTFLTRIFTKSTCPV